LVLKIPLCFDKNGLPKLTKLFNKKLLSISGGTGLFWLKGIDLSKFLFSSAKGEEQRLQEIINWYHEIAYLKISYNTLVSI
jgi:hypothetical protein